eukprot:5041893-Pyramimonas_sp.AAC.2
MEDSVRFDMQTKRSRSFSPNLGSQVRVEVLVVAVHRNDTFDVRKKEWEAAKEFSHNIPVSRGEAIILEKTLEELLPAGMVTAALRTGKRGTPGFDVHLFEKQYELVDMVLREAARQ